MVANCHIILVQNQINQNIQFKFHLLSLPVIYYLKAPKWDPKKTLKRVLKVSHLARRTLIDISAMRTLLASLVYLLAARDPIA
jgi:hypothetical protein